MEDVTDEVYLNTARHSFLNHFLGWHWIKIEKNAFTTNQRKMKQISVTDKLPGSENILLIDAAKKNAT